MKKVAITTFHAAINYGAVLQCAALSKFLNKQGYEAWVIDYQPQYMFRSVIRHPVKEMCEVYKETNGEYFFYRLFRAFRRFVRCLLDIGKYSGIKKRITGFDHFREENLRLTEKYTSLYELQKTPPSADIYVCGSDQLWNVGATGGKLDPVFFLDFGDRMKKRIAYAVSACNIQEKDEADFVRLLPRLDVISLRERRNKSLFEKMSGKEVSICPDPSILLTKEDYEPMEKVVKLDEEYIFVFLLSKNEAAKLCMELVKKIQSVDNVCVIDASVNKFCHFKNGKNAEYIAPGEWLYMIHHAKYVVTNSFHCMAFSAIFHKNLFVLPCPGDKIERLEEFTSRTGLKERLIYSKLDIESASINEPDYTGFDHYQKSSIEIAKQFIRAVE